MVTQPAGGTIATTVSGEHFTCTTGIANNYYTCTTPQDRAIQGMVELTVIDRPTDMEVGVT